MDADGSIAHAKLSLTPGSLIQSADSLELNWKSSSPVLNFVTSSIVIRPLGVGTDIFSARSLIVTSACSFSEERLRLISVASSKPTSTCLACRSVRCVTRGSSRGLSAGAELAVCSSASIGCRHVG